LEHIYCLSSQAEPVNTAHVLFVAGGACEELYDQE
jgi:hypothetical protein